MKFCGGVLCLFLDLIFLFLFSSVVHVYFPSHFIVLAIGNPLPGSFYYPPCPICIVFMLNICN